MPKKKFKEIIINNCYGGFGLSCEAMMEYAKLSGFKLYPLIDIKIGSNKFKPYSPEKQVPKSCIPYTEPYVIYYTKKPLNKDGTYKAKSWFRDDDIERDDPILIKVIRKLKKKANGSCADLKIVKIPADVDYEIEEYDGLEWVGEKHRTWD